ncbi:MAG: hypothetical protein GY832_28310 [Chloroflexi bacterium]|nr:hypothetical protein [Chloroflexota bacterium]
MHMGLKCRILCMLVLIAWAGEQGQCMAQDKPLEASTPDPLALLDKYEKTLLPYEEIRAEWRLKTYRLRANEKPELVGDEQNLTVLRKGRAAKTLVETINADRSQGVIEEINREGEHTFVLFPDGVASSMLKVPDGLFTERLSVVASTAAFGFIRGKEVIAFLRESELSAAADTLEGDPVHLVQGVLNGVEIKLWLDPSLDYIARRIRFHDPQDLRTSREYEVQRFREEGTHFVAQEASVTDIFFPRPIMSPMVEEEMRDGEVALVHKPATDESGRPIIASQESYLREIHLVSVDFDPQLVDGDFQLSQALPNGTKIEMQDAWQLDYIWKDGEIVPALDRNALASTEDARFISGRDSSRLWMVLTGAALLLAVLGFKLYDWRTSKAKDPGS